MRSNHTKIDSVVVLAGGGVDSAVLLAWCSRRFAQVHPLYVRWGLRWETAELGALRRFLRAARLRNVRPVSVLSEALSPGRLPRWSRPGGARAPGTRAAWDSVYLPGRNLLLLSRAAAWGAARGAGAVALGVLKDNPFPDATPAFLKSVERSASLALGRRVRVLAPWRGLEKEDVVRRGRGLPLHLTLSCIDPKRGRACGRCTKCFERRRGFARAGWVVPGM